MRAWTLFDTFTVAPKLQRQFILKKFCCQGYLVFSYLLLLYWLCLSLLSLLSSSYFWTLRCYSTMRTDNWNPARKEDFVWVWTFHSLSIQQYKNCTKHLTCSLRLTQHWLVKAFLVAESDVEIEDFAVGAAVLITYGRV